MARACQVPIGCLLAAVISTSGFAAASAQEAATRVVHESVSCPACRIVATRVRALRSALNLGEPFSAVRDRSGHIVVSLQASPPVVLNVRGTILRFLEAGRGRTDFSSPPVVFSCEHGLICALDPRAQRLYFYDSTLSCARELRSEMLPANSIVQLPNGEFVEAGVWPTPEMAGYPLHRYSTEGAWRASFGVDVPLFIDTASEGLQRSISPDGRGGFWAAHRSAWEIERWDSTLRVTLRIVRNPAWFQPYAQPHHLSPDSAPPPQLLAVIEDTAMGLVWSIARVPSTRWQSAGVTARVTPDGRRFYAPLHPDRLYQSLIEVLDPSKARVVARLRINATLVRLVPGGIAIGVRRSSRGTVTELWRLRLEGWSGGGVR